MRKPQVCVSNLLRRESKSARQTVKKSCKPQSHQTHSTQPDDRAQDQELRVGPTCRRMFPDTYRSRHFLTGMPGLAGVTDDPCTNRDGHAGCYHREARCSASRAGGQQIPSSHRTCSMYGHIATKSRLTTFDPASPWTTASSNRSTGSYATSVQTLTGLRRLRGRAAQSTPKKRVQL